MLKTLARPLFFLAFALVTVWTFLVPDAAGFLHPAFARIFFWHFPCSVLLLGYLFTAIYFSFRVFRRADQSLSLVDNAYERMQWDLRAESAMEMGFIWACLTMITGILFSLVQWGTWWQWDPRQTSFLIALLIYGAYFAFRNSLTDPERRAQFSAAYALSAALPIVFLVLVFPRIPQVEAVSFHPTNTILQGQLKGQYAIVWWVMTFLMATLSVWLYRMRIRASLLLMELDYKNASRTMEIPGGDTTPVSVVRPVAVPRKDGPAA